VPKAGIIVYTLIYQGIFPNQPQVMKILFIHIRCVNYIYLHFCCLNPVARHHPAEPAGLTVLPAGQCAAGTSPTVSEPPRPPG
jgi:hypothetical protein